MGARLLPFYWWIFGWSWASKRSPGDFFAVSFSSRNFHLQRRGSFNGLRRDGIWLDTIPGDSEFIPWWTRCDKLTCRLPGSHLILFGCFSYERWTSNNRPSPSTLLRLKRVTWWHASKNASQNERSMNWSNIWMKDYIRSEEFWHWHWHSPSLMAFVFFFWCWPGELWISLVYWPSLNLLSSWVVIKYNMHVLKQSGIPNKMNNAWDRYMQNINVGEQHLSTFAWLKNTWSNSGWKICKF